jgi:thioredoxin-related protein
MFAIMILSFSAVNAQNWLTNFDEAKQIAKQDGKKIVMSFQGSDWCAPCIKLDHEFFSKTEFLTYSKAHFVMLKVDFPRRKKNRLSKEQTKHNNNLAEKYNQKGNFPLVVVLNDEGKLVGKTGYDESITVSEFIQKIENY